MVGQKVMEMVGDGGTSLEKKWEQFGDGPMGMGTVG